MRTSPDVARALCAATALPRRLGTRRSACGRLGRVGGRCPTAKTARPRPARCTDQHPAPARLASSCLGRSPSVAAAMAQAQAGSSYKPYSPRSTRQIGSSSSSTPPPGGQPHPPGPNPHRLSYQQPAPPQPRFQHTHHSSFSGEVPARTGSPSGPYRGAGSTGTATPPPPPSSGAGPRPHSTSGGSRPVSPTKQNGAHAGQGGALGRVRGQMPYRADFQPQGVRRDRTEQFEQRRRAREDRNKLEIGRLGRRLEKVSTG